MTGPGFRCRRPVPDMPQRWGLCPSVVRADLPPWATTTRPWALPTAHLAVSHKPCGCLPYNPALPPSTQFILAPSGAGVWHSSVVSFHCGAQCSLRNQSHRAGNGFYEAFPILWEGNKIRNSGCKQEIRIGRLTSAAVMSLHRINGVKSDLCQPRATPDPDIHRGDHAESAVFPNRSVQAREL